MQRQQPPLLCLGMPKTGTASLAAALRILGYENIHHGKERVRDRKHSWEWEIFYRAASATFPNLPSYTGKPFTRADWDVLLHHFDAVTDVGSFFARSLIPAYPDAKVILTTRDADTWEPATDVIFGNMNSRWLQALIFAVEPWLGTYVARASVRFEMGWTGAHVPHDMIDNRRRAYLEHNEYVRKSVRRGQLLEVGLGDGWEPLCEFLGRDVPDVSFPFVNEAEAYREGRVSSLRWFRRRIVSRMGVVLVCVCVIYWIYRRVYT